MRHYTTPIRNPSMREDIKEAFSFTDAGVIQELANNVANGLGTHNQLFRIAISAFVEATLELGLAINTPEYVDERQDSAERIQNLAKWMIQRWGGDACESICRVGSIGMMIKAIDPKGGKYYIDIGGERKMLFDIIDLFQYALPNARAIRNDTFKNSLG